jgi:TRAP-type uncharacterized transport system fused permease subunit
MYMTLEGIFGVAVDVASSLIILFTIFGAFLQHSGAGKFYIDFSFSAMGGKPTGAGRTVVLASFLLGGPSGSGVATTVTLGAVAYPMLEKVGYEKNAAGGLLAAGGLGAIISPPVLGAAAFLIAEFLKISYLDVLLMAVIPTLLFYLALFLMVEIDARKYGMGNVAFEKVDSVWNLSKALLVPLPVAGLDRLLHAVGLLAGAVGVLGHRRRVRDELPAARYGAVLVRPVPRQRVGEGPPARLQVREGDGRRRARHAQRRRDLRGRRHHRRRRHADLASGLKFSSIVIDYAAGSLLLTALFTSLVVWVVGLAVPVTASYIICAVIAAPALIKLGVPTSPRTCSSSTTRFCPEVSPPTALSPFAAAAITGGDPYKTTLQCWKYTVPAFLLPFMFVLDPSGQGLLLMGSTKALAAANWASIAEVTLTAALGIAAIAGGFQGWVLRRATAIERVLLIVAGVALVYPGVVADVVGVVLIATVLAMQWFSLRVGARPQVP